MDQARDNAVGPSIGWLESIHGPTRLEIVAQNEDGSRVSCVRRAQDGFPLACSTVRFFADGARALGSHHDRILAGQPVGRTVAESGIGYERSEDPLVLIEANLATMLFVGGSSGVAARRITYCVGGNPYCEIGEFYGLAAIAGRIQIGTENSWRMYEDLQPWVGIARYGVFVDEEPLVNPATMTFLQKNVYWYLTDREVMMVGLITDARFNARRARALERALASPYFGVYLLAEPNGICGMATVDLTKIGRTRDGMPRFRCEFAENTQPNLQEYLRDYVERDLRGLIV